MSNLPRPTDEKAHLMRFSCTTLALLAAFALPTLAHAGSLPTPYDNFTIISGTDTLTFTLAASPTVSSSDPAGAFTLAGVPVVFDGVSTTDDLTFYTSGANGGGFADDFFDPFAAQLFTGDVASPTFVTGTFNFSDESLGGPVDGTITISSTPEPSSLFLLGTGVLGMAGVARRRIR